MFNPLLTYWPSLKDSWDASDDEDTEKSTKSTTSAVPSKPKKKQTLKEKIAERKAEELRKKEELAKKVCLYYYLYIYRKFMCAFVHVDDIMDLTHFFFPFSFNYNV